MGAFDPVFWNLFQTYGLRRDQVMSSMMLFYIAMVVFALMITGLYLSVREFLQVSAEPSEVKGSDPARETQ
jgi:hypothetical protein